MALSPDQLSAQLKSLKRGPAPKAPGPTSPTSPVAGMGAIDLHSIKLRKTGMRESLIETEEHAITSDELSNVFAARKKMFEQGSQKPATMPRPARPRKSSEEEIQKPRSDSVPDRMTDSNENVVNKGGTLKLRPLPTLQSLGLKPPQKPPKPLILTMKIEKKYKNHKVMIAPKVKTAIIEEVRNGSFDQGVEDDIIEDDIYDDINTGVPENPPSIPVYRPPPAPLPAEPELIEEDTYDDVEQLAEVVKSQLAQTQANQNIGSVNNENVDGEFGEDVYQPVEDTFSFETTIDVGPIDMDDEEAEEPTPAPPSRDSKEDVKAKKEREKKDKELQKKKERDEQRRKKEEERREREDKKRKEDEKKRKEKIHKEVKKAHKLKGNEPTVGKGTAKLDFAGSGNRDLPCTKGSFLEVIVKDNCPNGKWLVRDQQGHLGYVPSEILQLEANPEDNISADANLDEDLYECVDTFQSQSFAPPSAPVSDDFTEELYDDTVAADDEDFYEDLPGES